MVQPLALLAMYLVGWIIVSSLLMLIRSRRRTERFDVTPLMFIVRFPAGFRVFERFRGSRALKIYFTFSIALLVLCLIDFYRLTISFLLARLYRPETPGVFTPIIPGITISFDILPPLLIALSLAIVVHEVSHALAARVEGVRIKSAGVAGILALIFAAFVEVDEEELSRSHLMTRLRVYAAGVAANVILALLFMAILVNAYSHGVGLMIIEVGKGSPASRAGLEPGMVIVAVNGTRVGVEPVSKLIPSARYMNKTVSFVITVLAPGGEQKNITVVKPKGVRYIGIRVAHVPLLLAALGPSLAVFITNILFLGVAVNYGLALINAAPLVVTDGAKMVNDLLRLFLGEKARKLVAYTLYAVTAVLLVANFNLAPT